MSTRRMTCRALAVAMSLLPAPGCQRNAPELQIAGQRTVKAPQPAVIAADEGERRFLRGGAAPLLLKVDPINNGSRRMVLGSSDLPPGDAIGAHRHLQEDELIMILRGTARVRLGTRDYVATAGGTVFIPQGTCIALTNTGTDTLSNVFIFSSPGFEEVLRSVSSLPGEAPRVLTPEQRAAAFHRGHAEASPNDC